VGIASFTQLQTSKYTHVHTHTHRPTHPPTQRPTHPYPHICIKIRMYIYIYVYACICIYVCTYGHNLRMDFYFSCRCVRGGMMGGGRTNVWCQQGCMQAHGDNQWHRHCHFVLDNLGHGSCKPQNTKTTIRIKAIFPVPTLPLSFLSAPNSTAESPQIFRPASRTLSRTSNLWHPFSSPQAVAISRQNTSSDVT